MSTTAARPLAARVVGSKSLSFGLWCSPIRQRTKWNMLWRCGTWIAEYRSSLLLLGPEEAALAERAYGGQATADGCLDLGSRVSRKKEFIPPLTEAIGSL